MVQGYVTPNTKHKLCLQGWEGMNFDWEDEEDVVPAGWLTSRPADKIYIKLVLLCELLLLILRKCKDDVLVLL